MRRLPLLVVAAAVLATAAVTTAVLPGTAAPPASVASAAGPRSTVTLITGDQVVTAGVGKALRVVGVRPGPGRDRFGYLTATSKGRVFVYPRDTVELVRSGRLDERLFDVAGLVTMGYDDTHRSDLPLILGHPAGVRAAAPRGARITRDLPAVGMTAVRRPRTDAATFWRSVVAGSTDRIWLDGVAKVAIDQSVPQVGAPAAWEHGHTGKGALVAVLDTGYDRDHPDLAGKVVAEKDFTGNPGGVADGHGHGTHVASTAAGSGAAASGRHRGVAPDAALAVGKVCDDNGECPESAVLDGMLWAAAQRARVVNLSLGGGPSDGTDPLSAAVNELTERFGTLFVVAAGNLGAEETVSAPAVADAALAVASVTKQDTPSGFSSRGPRPGDHAVKPDIAAPGTDIVAARAAGTLPDAAVDERYARLSGTSMATPHVAGAAAILAGSHPDWPADRLKTVLMGTAKQVGDPGVYAIGTGRLDVAAADQATVWADRGSLSLGTLGQQKLTYYNDGADPVTLTLRATLTDRYGEPAPDGLLTAEPNSLTVPAHGTATTVITAKPEAARPGLFGGRLTATAGGHTVLTTGLGVNVQAEPRTLTVTAKAAKDLNGAVLAFAQHEETGEISLIVTDAERPTPVQLPAGRYRLAGEVSGVVPINGTPEYLVTNSTLFANRIDLANTDANLVLDGTTAKSIKRGVDDPAARQQAGFVGVDLPLPRTGDGQPASIGIATFNLHETFLLPSKKIDGLLLYDSAFWQEPLLSTTVAGTGREFRLWDFDPVDFLGDVTAPLVDVGQGRDEDLAGKPLRGAIALFTPPTGLPPDDLAHRITVLGKAGVALVILGEAEHLSGLPPTVGPVVAAFYIEVTELRELLAAGPVSLRIRGIENSVRGYFTYHQVKNRLPAGITWSDRRDQLAAVGTRFHDPRPHRNAVPLRAFVLTDRGYLTFSELGVRPPAKFTLHVTPGVQVAFDTVAEWPADSLPFGRQISDPREFSRGDRIDMHWQRAPYGPALSTRTTGTEGELLPLAYRTGNKLNLNLPMFTNSPGTGRYGWYDPRTDTGSTTLSRNGKQIARNDVPGIAGFDLPASTGRYELTVAAGYRLPNWPLASRITDQWSFTSGEVDGKQALPLLDVEYNLPLDLTNAAPAEKELTGTLQVTQQIGATPSRIASVGLAVSYDDGTTWQPAQVNHDSGKWTVRIPSGAHGQKFASLRTTATDTAGNTVTETLIRAYQLTL